MFEILKKQKKKKKESLKALKFHIIFCGVHLTLGPLRNVLESLPKNFDRLTYHPISLIIINEYGLFHIK